MTRVFLALDLPDEVRSCLAVQQFLLPLPRRIDPVLFHLTLLFMADVPDAALEAAHEGWSDLQISPCAVQIHGLGLFGGDRPRLVFANARQTAPLMALQSKVEIVARRAGCQPEARRFHPHVSLGRFPSPPLFEAMRLERAVAESTEFACPAFVAREMVLYESHRGGKSPHHIDLARYPFTA